jgi:hypothetical protein
MRHEFSEKSNDLQLTKICINGAQPANYRHKSSLAPRPLAGPPRRRRAIRQPTVHHSVRMRPANPGEFKCKQARARRPGRSLSVRLSGL